MKVMLWRKCAWGRKWTVQVLDPVLWDRVIPMWFLLVDQRDNIRPPIASASSEIMVHGHLCEQMQSWYQCLQQGKSSWRLWIGIGVRSTRIPSCSYSWLLLKFSLTSKPSKTKSDHTKPIYICLSLCCSFNFFFFCTGFGSTSSSELSFWSSFLSPVYTWFSKP